MRLHDFILTNRAKILTEWESFANSCMPASITMDVAALRDHADEMLTVIAKDLMTYQGRHDQSEKSMGRAPETDSTPPTAAEEHGAGRAQSGFTVEQMVAEYRALRASVLRLWTREQGELKSSDIEDLTRFNEAIDQSLAESLAEFNESVESAKELFLAILGHDLRTPLGAIHTSAKFMLDSDKLDDAHRPLTLRIATSSTRTIEMVGDLLDFTRSRLGGGIPVSRAEMDMGPVVRDVTDEISAAHPERVIEVQIGEQRGEWDSARMSQALTNLIANAVEYGASGTPVHVALRGDDENVAITVHNFGSHIQPGRLDGLFNPMKMRDVELKSAASAPTGSLGLGLYIAERIVNAHKGRIDVESSEEGGTTFTILMPRHSG